MELNDIQHRLLLSMHQNGFLASQPSEKHHLEPLANAGIIICEGFHIYRLTQQGKAFMEAGVKQ